MRRVRGRLFLGQYWVKVGELDSPQGVEFGWGVWGARYVYGSTLMVEALGNRDHASVSAKTLTKRAPHGWPGKLYSTTFATFDHQPSTNPTTAPKMVCTMDSLESTIRTKMLTSVAGRQILQPHAGAPHPEAGPQHLRRRVW